MTKSNFDRRTFLSTALKACAGTVAFAPASPALAWTGTRMRRSSTFVKRSFKESIGSLGLGSNLILCLDAGASSSYDGTSQIWTDLSGNNADFYRGASAASETSDPTFVGTAGGLSSSEYFSFDGNDYFTEKTAGWGDDVFHTDGATFTILTFVYLSNVGASQSIFHNYNPGGGTAFNLTSTGKIQFKVTTSASLIAQVNSTIGLTANQWSMLAISVNESSTTGGTFFINGATQTFNPTYTAPNTVPSTAPARIGSHADAGSQFLVNNTRIAGLMAWGRALSTAELTSLYQDVKARRLNSLP